VSICREWSIVKYGIEQRHVRVLYCRCWTCDTCAPRRKSQLMAQAASGLPTRFLTLTVNPTVGRNPNQRLQLLAHAWRILVMRLRRRYPQAPIEYLAIVEATERGEPHLHILLRSPYIPQAWLSSAMSEVLNSPIVDIRAIKNQRQVLYYIAKYITKKPAQFGTSKRYWSSRNYELPHEREDPSDLPELDPWTVVFRHVAQLLQDWRPYGWTATQYDDDLVIARYQNPPPKTLSSETF